MTKSVNQLIADLNDEQQEVVFDSSKRLCCVAGAGTGKTRTILAKILYLTEVENVDPSSILFLTFTNAASNEFQERYRQYSSKPITACTFHSFCYSLLLQHDRILKALNYSSIPSILSDTQPSVYWSKAKLLSSVKVPDKNLYIFRNSNHDSFEFKIFHKTLNKLFHKDNVISFDYLIYYVGKLFIDNDPAVFEFKYQYKYVFVDEFQDTDSFQFEFLKSFYDFSQITVVGDPRQAIYHFRGGTSEIIKGISKSDDWKTIPLVKSYRFGKNICKYSNKIHPFYDKSCDYPNLVCENDEKDIVKIVNNADKDSALEDIYEFLKTVDLSNSVVLCRTNKEVGLISQYLAYRGISIQKKSSQYLDCLARCAMDGSYKLDFYISSLKGADRYEFLKKTNCHPTLANLRELEVKFPETERAIKEIQAKPEFDEIANQYQLGNIRLDEINAKSVMAQSADSVYAGTIHSVKGQEFDNVVVYGVGSSSFLMNREENVNLYYVACTRARKRLIVLVG